MAWLSRRSWGLPQVRRRRQDHLRADGDGDRTGPRGRFGRHLRHIDQGQRGELDLAAGGPSPYDEARRRLVRALRPELLEGAALPEALGRLAERWSRETGTPAGLSVTGTPRPLPVPVEVTLLRAAQESLQNAHKHAGAGSVDLTLSFMEDLVVLDVHDDGAGFGSNGNAGGFGLRAMRERVEQLGGRLLIESHEGEGTTIVVELPTEASGHGHQAPAKDLKPET